MSPNVLLPLLFVMAWATIARAVLVFTQKLPPTCPECWRRYERRRLGEQVCDCHRSELRPSKLPPAPVPPRRFNRGRDPERDHERQN
jgi:hypothetical protein